MRLTKNTLSALIFTTIAVTACGGGGGGTISPVPAPPGSVGAPGPGVSATPSASPSPSPSPSPTATPTGTMTINVTPPLDDTSYATYQGSKLSYGVRLLSVNGVATAATPGVFTCVNGTANQICVSAPAGTDTFSVLYSDSIKGALAYANFTATISAGANVTASVTLLGIPAAYNLDLPATFGAGTIAAPFALTDADNYECRIEVHQCFFVPLSGTYASPVTITDTDTSGGTLLILNGGTASRSVTVTKASDQVAIVVAKGATVSAQLNVSGVWSFPEFGVSGSVIPGSTQSTVTFTCSSGSCYETGSGVIGISARARKP